MATFGLSDKELSENLFILCLEADASFDQKLQDALERSGVHYQVVNAQIDHQELIVFYTWLGQRLLSRPKVLNPLQVSYFLVSSQTIFSGRDGREVLQFVAQRYTEYDQAMRYAPEHLDIVYVANVIAGRLLSRAPDLQVHMPRIELIVSHIFTEWIISTSKTIKELA